MVIHIIFALLVWFVVPESLPRAQMSNSKLRHAEELVDVARGWENGDQTGLSFKFKRLFGFLTPLNIFLPEVTESGGNPMKHKKDWGLTLLALGYGFTISLMVSDVMSLNRTHLDLMYFFACLGNLYIQIPVCSFDVWVDL